MARPISSFLLPLLPLTLAAQTTWEVEAGGSTLGATPPYYSPMELTIEVGDHVHWDGVSGSHNVYGELDMFPDNPEGFSSGGPVPNLDFTYTFTLPGIYHYHCTQEGHSLTQHGTITVTSSQNVKEDTGIGRLLIYPVPAGSELNVELSGGLLRSAEVIALDGRILLNEAWGPLERRTIPLGGLAPGRYLLRLTDAQGRSAVRPFLKD